MDQEDQRDGLDRTVGELDHKVIPLRLRPGGPLRQTRLEKAVKGPGEQDRQDEVDEGCGILPQGDVPEALLHAREAVDPEGQLGLVALHELLVDQRPGQGAGLGGEVGRRRGGRIGLRGRRGERPQAPEQRGGAQEHPAGVGQSVQQTSVHGGDELVGDSATGKGLSVPAGVRG